MKIKISALAAGVLLLTVCSAQAELTFTWQANNPPLDGYYLYMDSADNKIMTLPADATTATIPTPTDGKPHAFYITAFLGKEESGNSDLAVWSPPTIPVERVRTFKVTGVLEVIE